MKYWMEYEGHQPQIIGKRNKFDNTIYTFDIETSSFLLLNNKIIKASDYLTLCKQDREECEFYSNMYIWTFSINDEVYFRKRMARLISFYE